MSSLKKVPSIESMERSLSQKLGRPVAIIPDLEEGMWGRFLTQPKHDDPSIPFGWSIVDDFIDDEPIESYLISVVVPDPPAPLVARPSSFDTIFQKIQKNVFMLVALYAAFSFVPSTPSISYPSPSISYPSPSISYPSLSTSYPFPSISYPSPSISYPSLSTSYPFPSISYPSPSISYPFPSISYPSPSISYPSSSSISYPSPSISSPLYFALPSAASASREIIDVQLCPTSTAIAIWVPSASFVKVPFNEASCKSDNSNKALVLVMTVEESPLPEFLKVIQTFSVYKVLSDVCGKQVSLFAKLNPSSTALVPASFQKQSVAIGMVPPPLLDSSTELTVITTELNLRLLFRSIRLMWLWLGFLVFILLPNENNQGFPRDRDHHGRSSSVYWQMLVLLFVTSTLFSEYFYGLLTSGILFPGFPAVALPLWSQSPVIVPVSSTAIIVWVPLASPNVSALNKVSFEAAHWPSTGMVVWMPLSRFYGFASRAVLVATGFVRLAWSCSWWWMLVGGFVFLISQYLLSGLRLSLKPTANNNDIGFHVENDDPTDWQDNLQVAEQDPPADPPTEPPTEPPAEVPAEQVDPPVEPPAEVPGEPTDPLVEPPAKVPAAPVEMPPPDPPAEQLVEVPPPKRPHRPVVEVVGLRRQPHRNCKKIQPDILPSRRHLWRECRNRAVAR